MPSGMEVWCSFFPSLAERLPSDWPQGSEACVSGRIWDCDGAGELGQGSAAAAT